MFASVMGRANHVLRLDCLSLDFEYIPFHAPDHVLVLCDSGVKHALVDSEYNTRRAECETGLQYFKEKYPNINSFRDITYQQVLAEEAQLPANIFKRCCYVVEELVRVDEVCKALIYNDLERIGLLMFACHEGLHEEYEVTCDETDFLFRQAMLHPDVLGARQMGGGFGGCTLNFISSDGIAQFTEDMTEAYYEKFGLELRCHVVSLEDGVEVFYSPNYS
jgi:galactokinase